MIKNENLTMLTDFYEITMANGYLQSGSMKEDIAYFDMFFRKVPDGGGYAIMAGVEQGNRLPEKFKIHRGGHRLSAEQRYFL